MIYQFEWDEINHCYNCPMYNSEFEACCLQMWEDGRLMEFYGYDTVLKMTETQRRMEECPIGLRWKP